MDSRPFREKMSCSPPPGFNVLPDGTHKHRGRHPLNVMRVRQRFLVLLVAACAFYVARRDDRLRQLMETPRFWGVSVSGFRLVLGALLGHLGAFLALRLSGGLRRRGYLLLARHFGFSPVSRRGLSGRWHDVLLMSRAVLALSTIDGVLARIKSRKNDDSPRSTRNSDSVGSWSSTSATHMQFLPCRLAAYSARSAAPMSNAGSLSCPACVAVTPTLIVTIPGPYCRVVEQVPQIYRAAQTRGPERIGWALARLVHGAAKAQPRCTRVCVQKEARATSAPLLLRHANVALLSSSRLI